MLISSPCETNTSHVSTAVTARKSDLLEVFGNFVESILINHDLDDETQCTTSWLTVVAK